MRKGQAGFEYITLLAILLIILLSFFSLSSSNSSDTLRSSQGQDAVTALAVAADEVYALGPGSRKDVWVTIPSGVRAASVNGSEISLRLSSGSDLVAFSSAPLTGAVPQGKGSYRVLVEHLDAGVVRVGDWNDTSPPLIVSSSPSGQTCNPVVLQVNTNEPAICRAGTGDDVFDNLPILMSGASLGHYANLGVLGQGNESYAVRCRDAAGNTMNSSAMVTFTVEYTGCGQGVNESIPPQVNLMSPLPGQEVLSSRVWFFYNVTDSSPIASCQLWVDNVAEALSAQPPLGVPNNVSADLAYGWHNWTVLCADVFGNTGNSSVRSLLVNATLDDQGPAVSLEKPGDGVVRNFNYVWFEYNATDALAAIDECSIHLEGQPDSAAPVFLEVTDLAIVEGATESFFMDLEIGNYTWNVSCLDTSIYLNEGVSGSWDLRVNKTVSSAFLASCAGQCGYEGYSDGICRQEPSKCANEGETWLAAGDEYCLGGAQSDTCCCRP